MAMRIHSRVTRVLAGPFRRRVRLRAGSAMRRTRMSACQVLTRLARAYLTRKTALLTTPLSILPASIRDTINVAR